MRAEGCGCSTRHARPQGRNGQELRLFAPSTIIFRDRQSHLEKGPQNTMTQKRAMTHISEIPKTSQRSQCHNGDVDSGCYSAAQIREGAQVRRYTVDLDDCVRTHLRDPRMNQWSIGERSTSREYHKEWRIPQRAHAWRLRVGLSWVL